MSFHCTKMQCNYRAYTWIVCETAINLLIDSEQCIEFEYVVLSCNSYYRMRIQCLNCVALCLQADCRKKSVSPACSIAEGRMPPQSMAHIIINFVSYRVLERTNERNSLPILQYTASTYTIHSRSAGEFYCSQYKCTQWNKFKWNNSRCKKYTNNTICV